jgi:hypothetical protein
MSKNTSDILVTRIFSSPARQRITPVVLEIGPSCLRYFRFAQIPSTRRQHRTGMP